MLWCTLASAYNIIKQQLYLYLLHVEQKTLLYVKAYVLSRISFSCAGRLSAPQTLEGYVKQFQMQTLPHMFFPYDTPYSPRKLSKYVFK